VARLAEQHHRRVVAEERRAVPPDAPRERGATRDEEERAVSFWFHERGDSSNSIETTQGLCHGQPPDTKTCDARSFEARGVRRTSPSRRGAASVVAPPPVPQPALPRGGASSERGSRPAPPLVDARCNDAAGTRLPTIERHK
jgi:hypothetical protein